MSVMDFAEELALYIRTGAPLIYVTALEVERAVLAIQTLCNEMQNVPECKVWRNTSGWDGDEDNLPDDVPAKVTGFETNTVCILVNFHWYIGENADPVRIQQLIDGYYIWKGDQPRTVIVLSPSYQVAPELDRLFQAVTYTLPPQERLRDALGSIIEAQEGAVPTPEPDEELKVLEAAAGLTEDEFENAVTLSILKNPEKRVDADIVMDEKAKSLTKTGYLDIWPNPDDLSAVGGMENLKDWLTRRETALGPEARKFGLPYPKGMMLLGVPGTGKSLVAKCVAKQWGLQLVRFDIGKVFGSLVGQSEERMRMILSQVEALSPCVLWIDEAEKGLAGAQNTGATDSGVTKRIFGTLISWMQERPKDKLIYMVMTVNDVLSLPPELLRKGRFDEIFWVDLPNDEEKMEILKIHLNKRGRLTSALEKDLPSLMSPANGFSGAELEVAVEDSMFEVFYNKGTEITVADLKTALSNTIPLSRTRGEEIDALRNWAKTRTKPAQKAEVVTPGAAGKRKVRV